MLDKKVTLKGVVYRSLSVAIGEALQAPLEKELDRHLGRRSQELGGLARHTIARELAEEIGEVFAEDIAAHLPDRLRKPLNSLARTGMRDFAASRGFRAMIRDFVRCEECLGDSSTSSDGVKGRDLICNW